MKNRFRIRGETLVETIIALSVLAVGVTIGSTVILNSIRNLTNAKNRVIAVNIAREGIEAVRSIRDTNWLVYSDRRRQCWNHDPSAVPNCIITPSPIPPGIYIVYKHAPEGSWRLQLAEDSLVDGSDPDVDPTNDLELAALSLVDIDLAVDSDNADKDNDDATGENDDTDMYNHMYDAVTFPVNSPLGTLVKSTIFSRYVKIEYLENQPLPPPNDSVDTLAEWGSVSQDLLNRIRVTSVVSWSHSNVLHKTELETILTDHLGREDLST